MEPQRSLLTELQETIAKQHASCMPNGDLEEVVIPERPAKNLPVALYDAMHKHFWMQNSRGEWVDYTESTLRSFLDLRHYVQHSSKDLRKWYVEQQLMETKLKLDVSFAGSLAGYSSGVTDVCGKRILVTDSPTMLRGREGEWKTFKDFIGQLLGDQEKVFHAWMKCALESFHAGEPFRPGQLLAIAGPPGCGKSLLQNIITRMLGGRSAKPYPFMTGKTEFNEELFSAEHLHIEDEAASTDIRIRRNFGNAIKAAIVNETQTMYPKGKKPKMLTPFWRMTISLNDEAENLSVLPPLDESLRDKITLVKASMVKFPYGIDDIKGRARWFDKLIAELPHYIHWLKRWKLPPNMAHQRYGCKAFQNADLLDALDDLTPEAKLLSLIDTLNIWVFENTPWEGTANELEDKLLEKDKMGRVAKLLSFNTACGVYLSRLLHRHPDRITQIGRKANKAYWRIEKSKESKDVPS